MVKDNRASLDRRELENNKKITFEESPYSGLVASNLTDENDPHHIYVKYSERKEEEPSTFQIPVSEYEWKTVKINDNKLIIWDDVVCSWADDNEGSIIKPKLTLNGKEIPQWHIISGKGKLTITITDDSDKKKARDIKINIINKAPEVKVIKPEVDVTWWKKVEVQNNNLLIWGDKVVEWSDDHTQNCTVTLSLNGNDVNLWDTLNEWWILTIRVIDKDWYESIRDINLHISYTDNNYGNIIILKKKPNNTMEVRNWLMHNAYLATDTEIYINNSTSYPTAISTIPFLKLLSIAEENRPWCTREEVIQIMRDNYLIEKQYKYKDKDWKIIEWLIYSIDIEKFNENEVEKFSKTADCLVEWYEGNYYKNTSDKEWTYNSASVNTKKNNGLEIIWYNPEKDK